MNPLTPEDETLPARAREGLEPAPEDHARIKHRLLLRIASSATAATVLSASADATATTTALGAAAAGAGLSALAKAVAAGVMGAAVVGGGIFAATRASNPAGPAGSLRAQERLAPAVVAPGALMAPRSAPVATTARTNAAPQLVTPLSRPAPASAPPAAAVRATNPPPEEDRASSMATAAGPATLGAEADLLARSDAALKGGDAPRALELLDKHAASFPEGALVEERESERVVVLCALGRSDDAHTLASAFLRERPRSPLAARVRASCGGP